MTLRDVPAPVIEQSMKLWHNARAVYARHPIKCVACDAHVHSECQPVDDVVIDVADNRSADPDKSGKYLLRIKQKFACMGCGHGNDFVVVMRRHADHTLDETFNCNSEVIAPVGGKVFTWQPEVVK